jgi:formylglycine-generating enzyme required for sulfatase activity
MGNFPRAIAGVLLTILWLPACQRAPAPLAAQTDKAATGNVTVSGDDSAARALGWRAPLRELRKSDLAKAHSQAARALAQGRLYADAEDAIPLYLSILQFAPGDAQAKQGLAHALTALLKQGDAALAQANNDAEALRRAAEIAVVARTLDPVNDKVAAYSSRVDTAEQLWSLNTEGERLLQAGELGEAGKGGALAAFASALELAPRQPRALQGIAAVESAMIRRAEAAAQASDFDIAQTWLNRAGQLRKQAITIADARQRVEDIRDSQIAHLRDEAIAEMVAPLTPLVLRRAREKLAEALRIAHPGDAVAADLRQRIELAAHYGRYQPGQIFRDGQGPEMIVVPHGAYTMGATADDIYAANDEKPAHYVRFERGFAIARQPVTVGEFRRFVQASGYRPRAMRRGHSIVYDERSGNCIRRNGANWQSDYTGAKADDKQPVIHVSVRDAEAYAEWLTAQTGRGYRLPSEAEYEYVARAGRQGRYVWGDENLPPNGAANLAGSEDVSPGGRRWNNAFADYGDGWWGPSPAGSYAANPFGVFDAGSNVSEWVADCWHASYRRAPADGVAWFNPGCRARVIRGGSWASSPRQVRASWRGSVDSDMTNARIGFRVVRGI